MVQSSLPVIRLPCYFQTSRVLDMPQIILVVLRDSFLLRLPLVWVRVDFQGGFACPRLWMVPDMARLQLRGVLLQRRVLSMAQICQESPLMTVSLSAVQSDQFRFAVDLRVQNYRLCRLSQSLG